MQKLKLENLKLREMNFELESKSMNLLSIRD